MHAKKKKFKAGLKAVYAA